ncbi:MAG: inverse autotransporter beta domain-containing protein [Alcanivorax sp.]
MPLKRFFQNTTFLCAALLITPHLSTPSLAQNASSKKWEGHIEAEGKISNDRSIGEGSVFIPVWQNDTSMLFTDIRGKFDNRDSEEMNLGLGYRQQINNSWILGGYAFYDRRNSGNDNTFHQATIGVEAMTEDLEFRINGYIPESSEEEIGGSTSTASINGGNFQIQNYSAPKERALPGIDVEVGKGFYLPKNWEVWAYAGGYHFDASGYEDVTGPRGRVEISKNFDNGMRFTAGLESQSDDVRGGQTFGIARLRVPFSAFGGGDKTPSRSLSKLDQRMTTRIIRDVDIVSGEQQGELLSTEAATFELDNGTKVSSFTTIDATGNIAADVTAAGDNAMIVVDGSQGTINTADRIQPRSGQTIIGGGASITVSGTSGATATLTLPGSRPTIDSTYTTTVTAGIMPGGHDITLQNMDITTDRAGVYINSHDRITLRDLVIRDTADDSIRIRNADDVTIENVSVYRPDGGDEEAIQIGSGSGDTYNNITIRNFYAEDVNIGILVVSEHIVNNLSLENVTMDQVGNVLETQTALSDGILNNPSGSITATNITGANCVNNGQINGSTLTINGVACP